MSTIQTKRTMAPADTDRIAKNRERELHGWAKFMGTSPERLERAVQAVGITPRKVRAYLREHA
ncbi:MAG TPA: DUF3606 domain-containing protein [Ramlibacter sp.]|nr:DUF3606 domain-containing protein [Ramlibacter sp.]